jgi:hypothetical protein
LLRRITFAVARGLADPIWGAGEFLLRLRYGSPRVLHQLRVRLAVQAEHLEEITEVLSNALELLRQYDARRYDRLLLDVHEIVVTNLITTGAFRPSSRSLYLSAQFIRAYSPANVALLVVHEATHAYLTSRGVVHWPELRDRIEHRCLVEEVSFAKRIPERAFPGIQEWAVRRQLRAESLLRGSSPSEGI